MHERYIEKAIKSALDQVTSYSCEIVISEDCSSDGTRRLCEQARNASPERIRLIAQDKNLGMDGNWRAVLGETRGTYVALLDGDDFWTREDKLQLQVDALMIAPEAVAACHSVDLYYDKPGEFRNAGAVGCLSRGLERAGEWSVIEWPDVRPATSSIILHRSVVEAALSDRFRGVHLNEMILEFIAAEMGKILFLPQTLAAYRIHEYGFWSGTTNVGRYSFMLGQVGALLRCEVFRDARTRDLLKTLWDFNLINLARSVVNESEFEDSLGKASEGEWAAYSMNSWAIAAACNAILEGKLRESQLLGSRSYRLGAALVSFARRLTPRGFDFMRRQ